MLAIDHGSARCGIAVSDPTGTLARPLAAVEPEPAAIARLVAEQDAALVVVGLPVSLSGEETGQARLARDFAAELGGLLEVPLETYDERLTTKMATQSARRGARADRDSLAAAHLLESFLAARDPGVRDAPAGEAEEAPPDE